MQPCTTAQLANHCSPQIRRRRTPASLTMTMTSVRDSRLLISCIVLSLLWMPTSTAFQVTMTTGSSYKPPVKSSVKKMYERRYGDAPSSSRSASSPQQQRSSSDRRTAKSAHAGTLSMPQPRSFEQRMRDMVLGSPAAVAPMQEQQGQQRSLPSNVQTIETLQDYKRVVGDEREKIVAVRFYATYCKVSDIRRQRVTARCLRFLTESRVLI